MKTKWIKKSVGAPLSDTPDEAERRLSNIRPREVSLVDSAANGRSFLIVKRRGDMKQKDKTLFKGDETTPAATATQAQAATETPVVTTEKQNETAAATAAEVSKSAPAAEGSFQKMAEETLAAIPVSKALVMEQKSMFMAMSDALMGIAMSLDMIRMDLMSFLTSDGKTAFMGEEVIKSLKAENPNDTDEQLTEKAGRKMKKDRLVKLKEAMGIIENLIKEMDDTQVNKGGQTMTAKKQDQETQKSADGSVASASAEQQPTQAAAVTTEANQEKVSLTKEELNTLVDQAVAKAVSPLKTEIEALKSAPAESASEGANSTEEVDVNKSKKQESIFKGVIR